MVFQLIYKLAAKKRIVIDNVQQDCCIVVKNAIVDDFSEIQLA